MYKQISFLFIFLFFVFACSSDTNDKETPTEKIDSVLTNNDSVEKNNTQEPFIIDYSSEHLTIGHYRDPIKLTEHDSELVLNFFKSKKGSVITFEIAKLIGETNASEEDFSDQMEMFVEDYYQTGENSLLFIRTFFGSGNGLTILSVNKGRIVSKILGILDADSDGTSLVSSKYSFLGDGQILIVVDIEEYELNETEINYFTIEQTKKSKHKYKLSVSNVGTIEVTENNTKESSEYVGMETLESWTKEDLRKLRNYIFAQYGYIFKSEDLSSYFKKFDWYEAKYSNVDDKLSKEDKEFVNLVLEIEKKK